MAAQIVETNGIRIAFEEFGDRSDSTVVLVMGLGTQMTAWPEGLCEELVARGNHVVRFDNRDVGLSEKFDGAPQPNMLLVLVASVLGIPISVPYKLIDMAKDVVDLMDALDIDSTHIVGASMGGMISQLFAANFPDRCLSLTSIMSTSGRRRLPRARASVTKRLFTRPRSTDYDTRVAHMMETYRIIGSPGFPQSDMELESKIRATISDSDESDSRKRHLMATLASGSRVAELRRITAPTLVLHGRDDPLVPVAHGIDTARCISNSRIEIIDGWGHDLPRPLLPRITELIDTHIRAS